MSDPANTMSSEVPIPEAAIEAASRVLPSAYAESCGLPDRLRDTAGDPSEWLVEARAAVEAAAPLIVAAYLEGLAAEYWSSSHLHRVCKARATALP
jgi:hypothetical protein